MWLSRPVQITATVREIDRARKGARYLPTTWGEIMKRLLLAGVALTALGLLNRADAADSTLPAKAPAGCKTVVDPYKNYSCLDAYLGDDYFTRLFNYYRLEWGHEAAPSDPKAPPGRRAYWPTTPEAIPPYPFTEWPYGGATALGVTRTASTDSPLMAALSNTAAGSWMSENHIQVYGWVNGGGNLSNNTVRGGNAPAGYDYNPNTVQLDQAVVYFERLPDTVQKDHIDWGFRVAPIFGESYRYTTAYGGFSSQLLNQNSNMGFDIPMAYGEVFFPGVMEGLMVRFGRYISIPDIEAQLAPNNYMYSHSMTYTFDGFTNTGIDLTLAVNKNWMVQAGLTVGTESLPWHVGQTITNPMPNALFSGTTFLKDPGATPSGTLGVRWTSDTGNDDFNLVATGINDGTWGYNNLQWYGLTYYHKFNDQWHVSIEAYNEHQDNVANLNNPLAAAAIAGGGTPFSPQYMPFNAPSGAQCGSAAVISCTATYEAVLMYLNYKASALDNITYRAEFTDDLQGQRTGIKTRYFETGLGWQHWLSPQIEVRPEVSFYKSLDANAFNGNSNLGIAPNKNTALIGAADIIIHF
jgi:putative OmpL-like beta-barrel porin-2